MAKVDRQNANGALRNQGTVFLFRHRGNIFRTIDTGSSKRTTGLRAIVSTVTHCPQRQK